MLKVYLIRHGATIGNSLKRYIGRTDEGLSYVGIQTIKEKQYPVADFVYVSPRRRCLETADIIYPQQFRDIIEDLQECDFGDFENKNYQELADNEDYQKWVDSNGSLPFPNGESLEGFSFRCIRSFTEIIERCFEQNYKQVSIVIHGGVIMNIMKHFVGGMDDFYAWFVENGEGYELQIDKELWNSNREIGPSFKMLYNKTL